MRLFRGVRGDQRLPTAGISRQKRGPTLATRDGEQHVPPLRQCERRAVLDFAPLRIERRQRYRVASLRGNLPQPVALHCKNDRVRRSPSGAKGRCRLFQPVYRARCARTGDWNRAQFVAGEETDRPSVRREERSGRPLRCGKQPGSVAVQRTHAEPFGRSFCDERDGTTVRRQSDRPNAPGVHPPLNPLKSQVDPRGPRSCGTQRTLPAHDRKREGRYGDQSQHPRTGLASWCGGGRRCRLRVLFTCIVKLEYRVTDVSQAAAGLLGQATPQQPVNGGRAGCG